MTSSPLSQKRLPSLSWSILLRVAATSEYRTGRDGGVEWSDSFEVLSRLFAVGSLMNGTEPNAKDDDAGWKVSVETEISL